MSHISIASAAPRATVPHNTEALRVEELIPGQLRQSSETFINLIKEYYDYLNKEGLPTYETNRIIDEHDIDKVSLKYLDGIQGEIAKNIPDSSVMDRTSLYKKIVQYYTLKGSEESITTFFRLFFDEIIEVSYPKEKLFELSSGDWKPANDTFTRSITASIAFEDLDVEYNYTPFQLKNDSDQVLGTGTIVNAEEVVLYDTAPNIESLVFDLNSKKNLNPINETWDSTVLDNVVRGYFHDGAAFNEFEELVKVDGKNAFIEFGNIGDNKDIPLDTEEHSFVIRTLPRFNKENTEIQPLFSLSNNYQQLHSHELFFNKTTQKIGRSFINTNEPRIALNSDGESFNFYNFIDETTVGLDALTGDRYEHMRSFLSPFDVKFNGKWEKTLISFNGEFVYVHTDDPILKTFTQDDLRFYQFTGTTFDGPNNLQIGQSIYGEGTNDFSGITALSEDGLTLAVGASKNDGNGNNSGHVRVYQLGGSPEIWSQVGADINGDSEGDLLGSDISLNADGTILAIGAPQNKSGDSLIGEVKVYELSGSNWVQRGAAVIGSTDDSKLGTSVSLNGAGDRLAFGSGAFPNKDFDLGLQSGGSLLLEDGGKIIGFRRPDRQSNETAVYEWNGSSWLQVGSDISETNNDPLSGNTVRLSDDGRTLVVGTHKVNDSGNIVMCVRAYYNKENTTTWNQLGRDLTFTASADKSVVPMSLSNDGKTVAIGILGDGIDPTFKGETEIYKLDNTNNWVKVGNTIEGEQIGGASGSSVSLNTNGDVIAIGEPKNDEEGNDAGQVRVYHYINDSWKKVGADINGYSDTGNAGSSVSLNGTGTRVVVGAPGNDQLGTNKGQVNAYQVAIDANIESFLLAEKNPSDTTSRWAIKFVNKVVYYTDWYDDITIVNPYDIGVKWYKGSKQGDLSLPTLPHCECVKKDIDHLFTLHNRGYMSIHYKHNGGYIPWQDITIGDTTEYDGERLWDILDYAVDDTHLILLDKPVNGTTRLVIFKHNEYHRYEYHQTVELNLPSTHSNVSDFAHIKYNNAQIVVGTHTFNNVDIAQVIHAYSIGNDGYWSSDQYISLPSVNTPTVVPDLEFNLNKEFTIGEWKSTDKAVRLVSSNLSDKVTLDRGAIFDTTTNTVGAGLGFDLDSKFSLAIRFNAKDLSNNITNIIKIGNVTLRILNNPLTNKKTLQVVSQESGKVDYPIFLDKIDTNVILDDNPRELFSDEYFDDEIKINEWNNLVIELTVNPGEKVITGLRYSLNGFKRSKSVDVLIDDSNIINADVTGFVYNGQTYSTVGSVYNGKIIWDAEDSGVVFTIFWNGSNWVQNISATPGVVYTVSTHDTDYPWLEADNTSINSAFNQFMPYADQQGPVHNIDSTSRIDLYKDIAFSHISFYNKDLTHIEFERIERTLSSDYTQTITTGINSLLDGGRFEVNETGTVIIKASAHGINIWEKLSESEWKNYYNPFTSVTNGTVNYITHNGSRLYSYKFFGDDLLLANGGLNNAQQYVEQYNYSSVYNKKEHNSASVLYYIKSQYLTSHNTWKVDRTFNPSVAFEQLDSDDFKVGLNYGVDIVIDNDNDMFAISLEPNSVNKILNGPNSTLLTAENNTTVKYDIWKKLSEDTIRSIPFIRPDEGFSSVTSYAGRLDNSSVLKIVDKAPSYNAVLSYPHLMFSTAVEKPIIKYTLDINGNPIGYYKQADQINSDFVISTAPSSAIYSSQAVVLNEFNIIMIRGKADRYSGYVDISYNGSDFERIIEGNTIRHLILAPESNLILAKNLNGYYNGDISHSQYYTGAISNYSKDQIVEYLRNNVKRFYKVLFDQLKGTVVGSTKITSMPTAKERFVLSDLDGHSFNSFLFFNEPQVDAGEVNTTIRVTANYNNTNVEANQIYWGDRRIDAILDNAPIIHRYTLEYLGEYFDKKGRASSVNRIQDSVFWQKFSYNIRSGTRVDDWEQLFLNLVHPAGLKFFASVILLVIRDNHWFGPKYVLFDPETRKNESILKVEDKFLSPFRTTQPLEDMRWLESLTAPTTAGGYHMPIFQPGWLQGDIRVREFIFEAGLWTKLARSVPGNNLASKYTYSYSDGNPAEDFEIRVLSLSGPELKIGDVVYQDVGSPPRQGVITNIGPDGNEFTGIIKLVGNSSGFEDGDIYTENSPPTTATIAAEPVKTKNEVIDVYGTEAQSAAYLQQDRSSIDINSEMFMRAVLTTFKYVIPSLVPQKEFTKYDYQQNLKFKEVDDISSYLNTTIKEALDNSDIFMNVGAIIKKRNQLYTEDDQGIFLERDSSPFDPDEGILLDDIAAWWNDPTNDNDISAPVQLNVTSHTGPQLVHGNIVYQDVVNNNGDNITIEGLIIGTLNGGNSVLVGWRGAINTSVSPDAALPSKPELDQLFRDGTIYTIVGQYDSPIIDKTHETDAVVVVSN